MGELIIEDKVLVFTRMPADGFDDFMSDPEAVLATVEDMGFDQEEMLRAMTASGDPSMLVQLMEGRWSGEEMNFSFENFWSHLEEKFPDDAILKLIEKEGRGSQIHTEYSEIRVLSQDQTKKVAQGLEVMELDNLILDDEVDMMLEDLFPAMKKFFSYAADAKEFVLVSWI